MGIHQLFDGFKYLIFKLRSEVIAFGVKKIRLHFLSFSVLLSMICFAPSGCKNNHAKNEKKPNIVIIFIDDLGYADLSCFGNPLVKTPNIDNLAKEGIKFTNFYANAPICSPSRVALNTGQYPMRYKIHTRLGNAEYNKEHALADFLDPSAPTLARTLQKNGYSTGHFGKWHMGGGRDIGNVPPVSEYGFDKSLVSFEGIGNRVLFPEDNLSEQSARLDRGNIIWAKKNISTSIYIDSAIAFIKDNKEKSFFINLCPNDVHDPHLPEPSAQKKYQSFTSNPYEQKFLAVLEELDHQIGRVINELDNMELLENTIIIFTSDNGPTDSPFYYKRENYPENYGGQLYPPGFTGEFSGRKKSLFEGGIRMPFIIQWKDHIPSSCTDSTTVLTAMDLFPSLCAILNIDYPRNLDGIDKSYALLGNPVHVTQPVMWDYSSALSETELPGNKNFISPDLAIREGDWKLLINTDSTDARLYNLIADPGEKNNLIDRETEKAKELAHKVMAWRRSMPVPIFKK
jgi:arylsulfatase A-like enzyme